jgi:hypothetical protein
MSIDFSKRQADRLRVMKAIFEAADGIESEVVRVAPIQQELGLSERELQDACDYLTGEDLITPGAMVAESPVYITVQLTHRGVTEMEQSLQAPNSPTEHFPPAVSIIHVGGNIIGSAIQSGSPGAQQEVTIGDINLGGVRDFLGQLEKLAPDLNLPVEDSQQLTAEIATIRAQVDSPRPKKQIVKESLHSVRAILEGAGGSMAATGLLDLLQHIHF